MKAALGRPQRFLAGGGRPYRRSNRSLRLTMRSGGRGAYEAVGVDALFFTGIKSRAELEAIASVTKLPIVLGGAPEDMNTLDYLSTQHVRIALQGHAPFAAATQAIYETLKALRDGVPPKSLKGLASSELTSRTTRGGRYKAAQRRIP